MTGGPQPGDFAVVCTQTRSTGLIEFGEMLAGGRKTSWDHAVIASRVVNGVLMIVEAMPSGSREVAWHYGNHPHKWSAGLITPCPEAGVASLQLTGRPYSWLDYAAIGAHRLHIPYPFLRDYIASSGHLICSQLVDEAYQLAGAHLFADNRWNGDVMPSDLGALIGG